MIFLDTVTLEHSNKLNSGFNCRETFGLLKLIGWLLRELKVLLGKTFGFGINPELSTKS